jgi:putative transposase
MSSTFPHRRRSVRVPGYDYSQPGAYFVTICVRDRECLLGDVVEERVVLNDVGRIVHDSWNRIPHHFPHVVTDAFIAMPNHLHGILIIVDHVGATHASPLQLDETNRRCGPKSGSLGAIVGSFKSAAARRINRFRDTAGVPFWQRGYYERILRDDAELDRVRHYILSNPYTWDIDEDNPKRIRDMTC